MTKDDFIRLYEKDFLGHCTPEEKQLLELYRDDFRLEEMSWDPVRMGEKAKTGHDVYEGLRRAIEEDGRLRAVPGKVVWMGMSRRVWIPAAAMILLVVISGIYFAGWKKVSRQVAVKGIGSDRFKNDVSPGGHKAVLILGDGARIVLDSAKNGELAQQGDAKVIKLGNGELAYHAVSANAPLTYNTISTPRGGQYRVVLPDGSKVWLNAASSLRFPTLFTGRERRVELMGEGYFEIAKNPSMPFMVSVMAAGAQAGNEQGGGERTEVEVLGTSFNVMAYTDESAVRATLLEGSVRIRKGADNKLLKPGQEAQLQRDGGLRVVENADIEEAVAWKNELFLFDNTDIRTAMRQIARWYDVDVRYEGISHGGFNGQISRKVNVSELLKMLELTGEAHFKIEGKQVTVLP